MVDTQTVTEGRKYGPPKERVRSANECAAALKLIEHICTNIVQCGDVPQNILEFADSVKHTIDALNLQPEGRDRERLYAAIETGLLPTFYGGSSRRDAGDALIRLIAATPDSEYVGELR